VLGSGIQRFPGQRLLEKDDFLPCAPKLMIMKELMIMKYAILKFSRHP